MRIFAGVLFVLFLSVTVGCGPRLQPAVQGEWSNVHNEKDKVTVNSRPDAEKPAARE
jgi:hypothetical protein